MTNPDDINVAKKPLLYALIGSVVAGALLGMIIVLRGTWGWFETRVILTTITIAIASLCGLACDLSRIPKTLNVLPKSGLAATLLSAALLILGIWIDSGSEVFWKLTATTSILAVATVHVCLLSIAKLAKRYSWVYFLAVQLIFGLALLLISMIIFELDDEPMPKLVAVMAISDAAVTLIIPLLHRVSRTDRKNTDLQTPLEHRNLAHIDAEIDRLRMRIAELEAARQQAVE